MNLTKYQLLAILLTEIGMLEDILERYKKNHPDTYEKLFNAAIRLQQLNYIENVDAWFLTPKGEELLDSLIKGRRLG
jgi:hypothetical protein